MILQFWITWNRELFESSVQLVRWRCDGFYFFGSGWILAAADVNFPLVESQFIQIFRQEISASSFASTGCRILPPTASITCIKHTAPRLPLDSFLVRRSPI